MTDHLFILRFVLVGGSTAFIFFGLTFGLVEFMGLSAAFASAIAWITANSYNYLLHYHWTFVSDSPHELAVTRYLLMCAGAFLINVFVMHFGVMLEIAHYMVIQFIAGITMTLWTLSVNFFWVFRSSPKTEQSAIPD